MDHTYIKGDRAVYTGASKLLHGDTCYEVEFVEGRRVGQKAVTYCAPGKVGNYTGIVCSGKA